MRSCDPTRFAIAMAIYSHVMPDVQRDTATKLDGHFAAVERSQCPQIRVSG
jgi:hypothetical protein